MNDLTEYELEVITTGRKLLSDTNTGNYIKFAGGFGDDIIHVFKNNGVWCTYFAERGNIFDYKEFDDVYDVMLEVLGSNYFPNENVCYYMTNFPSKNYFERGKAR